VIFDPELLDAIGDRSIVRHLERLGGTVSDADSPRSSIEAASFAIEDQERNTLDVDGVRTHARKQEHHSRDVLEPLGLENRVRASASHYDTRAEVGRTLGPVNRLAGS